MFWWTFLELVGSCICCHTQSEGIGSLLQRSHYSSVLKKIAMISLWPFFYLTAVSVKESNTGHHAGEWGIPYNSPFNGLEAT